MKINEYKNEVDSLRLSDEFKQQLKENLLAKLEEQKPAIEVTNTNKSFDFAKKYSKYIALAACLLLVISTVSIATLSGLPSKDSANVPEEQNRSIDANQVTDDVDTADDTAAIEDAFDYSAPNDLILENSSPNAITTKTSDEVTEGVQDDDGIAAQSYEDDSEEESDDLVIADEAPVETIPCTDSPYSEYASPEYDGDYNGDDYVLSESSTSANISTSVLTSLNLDTTVLKPYQPQVESTGQNLNPSGSGVTGAIPNTSEEGAEEDVDEVEPVEAPVEDLEADEPEAATESEDDVDIDLDTLMSGYSYGYYDLRDGIISDLDEVALIRFTVEDAYSGIDELTKNVTTEITIDPSAQTLYRVNVTHEYLENEEKNVEKLLIADGSESYQLIGRPVMSGEYIAIAYENNDGILETVPQLVYAVHNVNGLDIAYHLYSSDGYKVDPGSTNMGILPEEQTLITTTVNNPEIYTQKAAVRELTYYIRRNLMRLEPKILDLENSAPEQNESETAEEPVENIVRSSVRANFPTGKLILTNTDPDADGLIAVNGISVGDDLETALKAFYLSDYSFTPNAVLTLIASEEDGRWSVKVKFQDGIVSEIVPQK